MGQYFAQKQHEKVEMRRLVEATSAGQQNVREARAKLTAMKQKIGVFCTLFLVYMYQLPEFYLQFNRSHKKIKS